MRRYENVRIDKLKPYKNNARTHSESQIEKIANSIVEFGFINPVLIDSDYGIIAGHGRVEGAKRLSKEDAEKVLHNGNEIPCIFVEDLTEEQKRAYIIADNKLALDAGWDRELLKIELEELDNLDFDITLTGFELGDINFEFEKDEVANEKTPTVQYVENDLLRIRRQFNIEEFDENRAEGMFQMPIIRGVDFVPSKLKGFNYAKSSKEFDFGIHFYIDDYQFERIWNDPYPYIDLLSQFECVLTPHYSVYSDMAFPIRVYNTYRSKLLGQMMQDAGLIVIPTVYWGWEDTYDYEFDGLPENSTLSIYTMNWDNTEENKELNEKGLKELIKRKSPKRLLIYSNGKEIDFDFGDIEVIYYKNEVYERLRGDIEAY